MIFRAVIAPHKKILFATQLKKAVSPDKNVSDLSYLILTIDCANTPSCKLAEKCGFELFEKRTPIGHKQPTFFTMDGPCTERCMALLFFGISCNTRLAPKIK